MAKYHKEAMEHEVFVGNFSSKGGETVCIPDFLSSLKTARLGDQAYSIDGYPISQDEYRPLFVHKDEYEAYNRIMMKRTFPNQRIW